jgi:hypothetical protein
MSAFLINPAEGRCLVCKNEQRVPKWVREKKDHSHCITKQAFMFLYLTNHTILGTTTRNIFLNSFKQETIK